MRVPTCHYENKDNHDRSLISLRCISIRSDKTCIVLYPLIVSLLHLSTKTSICSAHPAGQNKLKKPVSLQSKIEECRKEARYYTMPDCIDHEDGYGCECGPGYKWNSAVCVATSVDSRLDFLG